MAPKALHDWISWFKDNAETGVALVLTSTVSVLGILDLVSADLISKVIPLTLAIFAFALLRERWRRDTSQREIQQVVQQTSSLLTDILPRLDRLTDFERINSNMGSLLSDISAVRTVTGEDISVALTDARLDTSIWMFKGGTGTFTRLVTLPECLRNARRQRRELRIYLEILDPSDFELCESYANLYKSLAENPTDNELSWDGDGTRRELYATVLAACWYHKRYQLLGIEIEVGLSSTYSTLRWDLSTRSIIITQRGPRFPAMVIEKGKLHYASWHTELWSSFEQCRKLPIKSTRSLPLGERPSVAEVQELFRVLDLKLPEEYDNNAIEDIIEKAFHDKDPYTRGAGDSVSPAGRRSASETA